MKLLDLYCGAGGAGQGYIDAGFDVTGIDINPQPDYPGKFIQGDALAYLAAHGHEYDARHASPPCQASSALYVIGARPSVGKSVVGLQLARGLAEHGSVAFMSLEMSVHDVNVRLMAADLKIDMRRLMRNELTPGDWNKIGPWMQTRGNMPLAVNDNTGASITDIKRFVRNVHRRKPLAGVVVDYLQLMSQQPGDKRARHEFVADMSRQLKVMAMELGVPVIALSQLNRGSTARDDQRPKISDLRESGAVEQDADAVILLHREIDTDKKGEIDMLVGKNRNGPTGSTSMQFSGHYASIQDYG